MGGGVESCCVVRVDGADGPVVNKITLCASSWYFKLLHLHMFCVRDTKIKEDEFLARDKYCGCLICICCRINTMLDILIQMV
jgi:hypothetical protein